MPAPVIARLPPVSDVAPPALSTTLPPVTLPLASRITVPRSQPGSFDSGWSQKL
jgi:hypothetical protein